MTEDRKMLEPMATVVSIVLRTLLALLAAGLVHSTIHGSWGDVFVCIADDSTTSSVTADDFVPENGAQVDSIPRYCAESPDAHLRLLNELGELPSTLLLISGLFLLHRLLQGAARDGVYTVQTASRLRLLGWWLLVGSLVVEIIEANARAALLAELAETADFSAGTWLSMWTAPYLAVLTGLGLLTFARITRAGTSMREDLEGVV
ncbi:DUF2975 domain-containing protein [Streptomyces himalayensis]|uniref:DUF2975 domain-containing protein n=1 Tax=Streptomyces himalayensis subsp. himalayensis TaxID=2756131 RepID=A0A7W0DQN8_9ACTN|nr:DUF2975 domain-containing protein [Streptomyces himalayensis]MBA2949484.1 DUF2975 domain-containing protein [Streptomyces himalayensis subsp. himalayensis]